LDQILKTENFDTEVIINKTPEKVLQIVAKLHSTTQSEIIGKNRDKNVSTARQIIMYLWHKNFGLSLPIIGKMLKRDHTTILHGTQKIQKEIQNDPQIASKIKEILKTLEA
jgi:chromosomal replication initiator protein